MTLVRYSAGIISELMLRIEPVPMTTRAHALLTGSPYQAEILKIRERSAAREAWLYEKLRRTDDELQVRRIAQRPRGIPTRLAGHRQAAGCPVGCR